MNNTIMKVTRWMALCLAIPHLAFAQAPATPNTPAAPAPVVAPALKTAAPAADAIPALQAPTPEVRAAVNPDAPDAVTLVVISPDKLREKAYVFDIEEIAGPGARLVRIEGNKAYVEVPAPAPAPAAPKSVFTVTPYGTIDLGFQVRDDGTWGFTPNGHSVSNIGVKFLYTNPERFFTTIGLVLEFGIDPAGGWGQVNTTNTGPLQPACKVTGLVDGDAYGCQIDLGGAVALAPNRGAYVMLDNKWLTIKIGRQPTVIEGVVQGTWAGKDLGSAAPLSYVTLADTGLATALWTPFAVSAQGKIEFSKTVKASVLAQASKRMLVDNGNEGLVVAGRATLTVADVIPGAVELSAAAHHNNLDAGDKTIWNAHADWLYEVAPGVKIGALYVYQHYSSGSFDENPATAFLTNSHSVGVTVNPGNLAFTAAFAWMERKHTPADYEMGSFCAKYKDEPITYYTCAAYTWNSDGGAAGPAYASHAAPIFSPALDGDGALVRGGVEFRY